jgi:acetyl esterase/lipase
MDDAGKPKAGGGVKLGPIVVPDPQAASPEARKYLNTPFWAGEREDPHPDDIEAWKKAVAQLDAMTVPMVEAMHASSNADVQKTPMAGVTVYVGTPRDLSADRKDKAHLHIHGGGWAYMGGAACGGAAAVQATQFGVTAYSVDYRVPPEHRFPAALDDCLAVYRELLKTYAPNNIVVSGGSAGGNLSAALALRIKDEGLPQPAAFALLTPCSDGKTLSDTFTVNDQLDFLKAKTMGGFWDVYAGGHDRGDPYLSPVYGDFSGVTSAFLLQSGTRDLLLSDTVRLHRAIRRGGVRAELHVWEAMPHGGFGGGAPEDADLTAEVMALFERNWG